MSIDHPELGLLRSAARSQGTTQRRLAERAGLSPSWLSEIMTGRRAASAAALCRLAELTGVTAPQMRAAGREDVADLLDATPATELDRLSDHELIGEMYRRSQQPSRLLIAIRATIEETIDLPTHTYRWLGYLAYAGTLADLLRTVTETQRRTPDLLTQYLGSISGAHPAVLAAAVLAACDLRSDRELATLLDRDNSTDAHARANLVGTADHRGITYPALLERWIQHGELYLAQDPRDIPDLP